MHLRSLATLCLALSLAACTALFLPTEERVATTLELTPREITVRDQESVALTVTLLDQHGEPFEEIPETLPVEWILSDPELAYLHEGRLKGEKQGRGSLRVNVGELTTAAPLTVLGVPRSLRRAGEDQAIGIAGRALAEPVGVRVVDRLGTAVAGVPVRFRIVSGSGSVAAAAVESDAEGLARTLWTLGPITGENVVEVTSDSLKDEVVSFTATGVPDAVARLERVSGDGQEAPAGSTLAQDLVVRALDAHGNVVPLSPVAWTTDGGAVTPVSSMTDELGIARARWRLHTAAGPLVATARAGKSQAAFAATGVPGPPARLQIVSGDRQSGPEFSPLPDSLAVRVSDVHDNPVPGVAVQWLVTHGGGSVATAKAKATRADGITRASWTVGVSLPNAVSASALGQSVRFTSTPRPLVPRDTLRTASGLPYLEVELSRDTLIVADTDMVSVYFSAYLLDGTLLERITEPDDTPLRFIVGSGQVIAGFDDGVVAMRKGSTRRLFVPSAMGYRDGAMDHIPPNSTLVFDVKVVEVLKVEGAASPSPTRLPSGGLRPRELLYTGERR